jgi:hypothetical protein
VHSHVSTSAHPSDRSRPASFAKALLDPFSILPGPTLHQFDLGPRWRWMDVMLEHVSDIFKAGFRQLVDKGFEFFASGHGGERIACLNHSTKA